MSADPATPEPGAWVAAYSDNSGFAVFGSELDALRAVVAAGGGQDVFYVRFGEDIGDARARLRKAHQVDA